MLVRCTARHGPAVEVIRRPFQAEWAAVVLLAGSHASERRIAAPDCMAEVAVNVGPVSAPDSLLTGNLTGIP